MSARIVAVVAACGALTGCLPDYTCQGDNSRCVVPSDHARLSRIIRGSHSREAQANIGMACVGAIKYQRVKNEQSMPTPNRNAEWP